VDYDFVGLQVHASGELWSAANVDIRAAMMQRYGSGNPALQRACATGEKAVTACPGNRRWIQLVFDSLLLMAVSQVSMVDARDAMLAADLIRFGGANQDLLWNAFAKRGLGETAASNGSGDANPLPGFTSPYADEATVTFRPVDDNVAIADAELYVGRYQARGVPVADTNAATALTDQVRLVPGVYEFIVHAPGRGHLRVGPIELKAGQVRDLAVNLRQNLAAAAAGATATGDGINLARLIDDDEATNWVSLDATVACKQVTVDLAGGAQQIRRVQVSAMLRPQHRERPGRFGVEPVLGAAAVPGAGVRGEGRYSPTSAPARRTTPVSRTPTRARTPTARRRARKRSTCASPSSRRSRSRSMSRQARDPACDQALVTGRSLLLCGARPHASDRRAEGLRGGTVGQCSRSRPSSPSTPASGTRSGPPCSAPPATCRTAPAAYSRSTLEPWQRLRVSKMYPARSVISS